MICRQSLKRPLATYGLRLAVTVGTPPNRSQTVACPMYLRFAGLLLQLALPYAINHTFSAWLNTVYGFDFRGTCGPLPAQPFRAAGGPPTAATLQFAARPTAPKPHSRQKFAVCNFGRVVCALQCHKPMLFVGGLCSLQFAFFRHLSATNGSTTRQAVGGRSPLGRGKNVRFPPLLTLWARNGQGQATAMHMQVRLSPALRPSSRRTAFPAWRKSVVCTSSPPAL